MGDAKIFDSILATVRNGPIGIKPDQKSVRLNRPRNVNRFLIAVFQVDQIPVDNVSYLLQMDDNRFSMAENACTAPAMIVSPEPVRFSNSDICSTKRFHIDPVTFPYPAK